VWFTGEIQKHVLSELWRLQSGEFKSDGGWDNLVDRNNGIEVGRVHYLLERWTLY